jgi:hypothetical protein
LCIRKLNKKGKSVTQEKAAEADRRADRKIVNIKSVVTNPYLVKFSFSNILKLI